MHRNLRALMPALKNKLYFNYGGQGPLPKPSLNEIIKSWEKIQTIGPFTNKVWPYISREVLYTKQLLSKILGVNIKNISLSENISTGMIFPLWGIKFKEGDELLISDCEHPGIVAASRELCRRNKLKFTIFPIQKIKKLNDQEFIYRISRYLNPQIKIIIISHVLWNFGYKVPLKAIKNQLSEIKNDPYLIVDGAQSFCHIDIKDEVMHTDLYSITSHKWACGPEGLGAFFVSNRFIKETDPTIIGWKSLKKEQGIYEPSENLFHEDARKFEVATSCVPLLAGLRKSLNLLEEDLSGKEKNKLITSMSNKLWAELYEIESIKLVLNQPLDNGIVSFNIENIIDKNKFIEKLGEKNIWIRVIEDPKWFRVCIHQMTTKKEIDLLINGIKLILRN